MNALFPSRVLFGNLFAKAIREQVPIFRSFGKNERTVSLKSLVFKRAMKISVHTFTLPFTLRFVTFESYALIKQCHINIFERDQIKRK